MRTIYIIAIMSVASVACYGQANLVASVSGASRLEVVKNTIHIDEWHEKSFWPLYGKYSSKCEGLSLQVYQALNDVASIGKEVSDQEAYDYSMSLINLRYDMFNVLQQYYQEIGNEFNGIVALQFVQTEVLLDMMESCRIYESTPIKQFRFHPKIISMPELKAAKYNIISKALMLTPEQATAFYRIYTKYEEECDALLGNDYSLVGFYAGEASDYTPALAKHLGSDFLRVMKRELMLKEKYFKEFNNAIGPSTAARFLAWEDYYSVVNKMYAWADAP
jgi:hypothetical protein